MNKRGTNERSKKKVEKKEVKKEDDKWEYPIIIAWRLFVCLELGMS
jgi:hypothetical protein